MRAVDVHGVVHPAQRRVTGTLTASIATPLGRVPIRGHVDMSLDCAGTFAGTIAYHPFVRLLARLKNVRLASELDGAFTDFTEGSCAVLTADTMRGSARIDRQQLSGSIRIADDTIKLVGTAWTLGDGIHRSVLAVSRANRTIEVRVNIYERGTRAQSAPLQARPLISAVSAAPQ